MARRVRPRQASACGRAGCRHAGVVEGQRQRKSEGVQADPHAKAGVYGALGVALRRLASSASRGPPTTCPTLNGVVSLPHERPGTTVAVRSKSKALSPPSRGESPLRGAKCSCN